MKTHLTLQGVCGPDNLFYSVSVKWPGATHDTRVFNNSRVKQLMETGIYKSHLYILYTITRNKGSQSLLMCETQSWITCKEFNKEIKIGPIYERCSRLILLIWYSEVSWILNLSSIITHGSGSEYEYDAYLPYRKLRKMQLDVDLSPPANIMTLTHVIFDPDPWPWTLPVINV